ncbi:MAG: hypothetical protein HFF08_11095, partial [Oscillospiraceae bacterium]|nr:hypothetical protein [Oscillospiraceae bacterium]
MPRVRAGMEYKQASDDPVVWLPLPAVPGQVQAATQDPTERSKHMRNEVIFDSRGIPDIMVVFTPDELGLPAEIRGKAVKEYAISK